MKLKHSFMTLLAMAGLAFAAASCDPAEDEDLGGIELSFATETINFESSAEDSFELKFKSTRDWQAVIGANDAEWLSLSAMKGSASSKEQSVKVNVLANEGKDRIGTITFSMYSGTASLGSKTVTVNQPGSQGSAFITIAELRAIRDGETDAEKAVTIPDGTAIKGQVVSNVATDNYNSKKAMYVQDETAGVMMYLDANCTFAFGDEVSIDLSGIEYKLYGGAHQLNNVPIAKVTKIKNSAVTAKVITEAEFMSGKYEGMYVQLDGVQVASADLSKNWYNGTATYGNINMQYQSGAAFVVRTGKNCSFKAVKVSQGSGSIKGIPSVYNGTIQFSMTAESDYAGLTGERFKLISTEATIAEILAATGGQFKVKGAVIAVASNGFMINDGGDKNLYIYYDKAAIEDGVKVGASVQVEGTHSVYGEVIELKEPTTTVISEVITPKEQDPTVLSGAEIDSYKNSSSALVQIEGEYKKDGNYHNLEISGASHKGSLSNCEVSNGMTTGTRYVVTGYFTGITGTYFSVLPIKAEVSNAKVFGVSTTAINVLATAQSAQFEVKGNCSWTAKSDNEAFTLRPTEGTGAAQVNVVFSENTTDADRVANITVTTTEDVAVKSYTVVVTQAKKSSGGTAYFTRITDAPTDWSGTYLIVNEDEKVALDGSKTSDVASNTVSVTIAEDKTITATDALMASVFYIKAMDGGYSVMAAAGKYIYGKSGSNVLNFGDEAKLMKISINDSDNKSSEILDSSAGTHVRYNADSGQKRFRFYKTTSTGVKSVYLYKLVD